jgi:dTMP kinase
MRALSNKWETMPTLKKGVLIVFEGIDGAGKSTQAKLLHRRFEDAGFDVVFSKEPTEGVWGKKIQKVIREGREAVTPEKELEWFVKDRKEHVAATIRPSLDQHNIIILDRYYFSTIAYQGALGLDPEQIERTNTCFAPPPDLLFLVDVSPDLGLRRIVQARQHGADFFERKQYLAKVHAMFARLNKPFLHRLPGERPVEDLAHETWGIVQRYLRTEKLVEK